MAVAFSSSLARTDWLSVTSDDCATISHLAQSITHTLYDANQEAKIAAGLLLGAGGHKVLELLSEEDFDVALLDVHMPELDGLETARRWREQELLTFVSYQIANSLQRREHAEALRRLQRCDALRKPERCRELLRAIEGLALADPDGGAAVRRSIRRLDRALQALLGFDSAAAVRQAQADGAMGEQIGERLHTARLHYLLQRDIWND